MSRFVYWPYDEVSLRVSDDGGTVVVKTPWLEARVPITEANQANFQALVHKFSEGSLGGKDLSLVNWFFAQFAQYPFCYILPGKKADEALDRHTLDDAGLGDASLGELLAQALQGIDASKKLTATLARTTWDWDTDSALTFAKTDDKVNPESLFTVVRRYHLLDVLETNKGRKNFDFIEALDGESFALAAGLMVRQNHYVTQHCQTALKPAVAKAGNAAPLVEAFIQEENGHDKILGVAMQSFAEDPESVPATAATQALMQLLEFAARRNFLAFAMAVDCFERSSYEDTDPLAKLLIKGGFEKAARQINRHMDINDAGGHENVALGFLQHMAPVDGAYALEAMRIAEAVTLVMNSVPQSAVDLYQKLRAN